MSRDKITRNSAPLADNSSIGESGSASKSPMDRDIAAEIVATIGADNLLDIKFLIESSSATRDEILVAALKWIKSAEKKFSEGTLLPISN
jgi:hypothetical protein